MKPTGIVRRIDDLGRIVIPKELRRSLNITYDAPMEIFIDGEMICLKKYAPEMNTSDAAQNFIANNQIDNMRFTIEGRRTICDGEYNGKHIWGSSTRNPSDKNEPIVGMAHALARARGKDFNPKEWV